MSKIGNYVVGLQEQEFFIECPECKDTDQHGKVTSEEYKWTGDMLSLIHI